MFVLHHTAPHKEEKKEGSGRNFLNIWELCIHQSAVKVKKKRVEMRSNLCYNRDVNKQR